MTTITIHLTKTDIEELKSLPVSVSRILKTAVGLLTADDSMQALEEDSDVTADYLRALEPLLDRLFMQAKGQIR